MTVSLLLQLLVARVDFIRTLMLNSLGKGAATLLIEAEVRMYTYWLDHSCVREGQTSSTSQA